MKNWTKRIIYILPALIIFYACTPEIDVPAPSAGGIDFSNYIAVGNSLTAGYADRGLYADGQLQSYPNQIAQQMSAISPINFRQPDIPGNGSGYLYLKSLAPEIGTIDADPDWLVQLEGPFNNLGVPGIRVRDINFPGYGSSPQVNPFFYRMLGGQSPITTYLKVVEDSNPTFFTCWIGSNDVLGYASSGGSAGIDGGQLGLGGLTPVDVFDNFYGQLMSALTSTNAKGVLITIPKVTLSPFFTTVPYLSIPLDEQTASALMGITAFGGYNAVLAGLVAQNIITAEDAERRKVTYGEGINPVLIVDKALDDIGPILGSINPALAMYGQVRQTDSNDLILLTALGVLGELADPGNPLSAIGVVVPMGDEYSLTESEIKNVNDYTDQYNQIILGYGADQNIGVVEINDLLEDINNGVFIDGVNVSGGFISGGAFSLDGVHLTPRGYALIANDIIQTINTEFNARISPVNLNNYRAVILP